MMCLKNLAIMPEFLEFLFPFGLREHAEDFYFGGFRQHISLREQELNILGPCSRSLMGRFEICFNLRSAEPWGDSDWSIRHCAFYHSFSVRQVQSQWAIVKGDDLIRRRIESMFGPSGTCQASDFESLARAFMVSLDTHLVFCNWSAENWRWYINTLEEKFQSLTRRALAASINLPLLPKADIDKFRMRPRASTGGTARSTVTRLSRAFSQIKDKRKSRSANREPNAISQTPFTTGMSSSQSYPGPEDDTDDDTDDDADDDTDEEEDTLNSPGSGNKKSDDEHQEFSFPKLRKVHGISEKVQEATLVLKQNISVLSQLRKFYASAMKRTGFPESVSQTCETAIADFEAHVLRLEEDMNIQIMRLDALSRLLQDRKTFVSLNEIV